jgi:hypothetical protein
MKVNDKRSESGEPLGGGGQGGICSRKYGSTGGGGGGYDLPGANAEPNRYGGGVHPGGKGGEACGVPSLMCIGAGGGGGNGYSSGVGGIGGRGGGLILIRCRELSNSGRILADGSQGEDAPAGYGSGGGGGSGGGIRIEAESILDLGTVSTRGGRGGNAGETTSTGINSRGGDGGDGRVRIVARSSVTTGSTIAPSHAPAAAAPIAPPNQGENDFLEGGRDMFGEGGGGGGGDY